MTAIAYRLTNSRITNLNFVVTTALAVLTALIIFTLDIRLVLALFVVPWFIFFFYKKPMILVCLWPLVSLLEVFFPWVPLRIGGVRLLPLDPIYFFTIFVLATRFVTQPRAFLNILRQNKYLTAFLAMVLVNAILYIPVNGQSAIGEARKYYFVFFFPLLAAIAIKSFEDIKRFFFVVILAAIAVSFVAVYRATVLHTIVRVLNSEATLILALVALALLVCWINKVVLISLPMHGGLLATFTLFSVGSGQRSVWLAIGTGLMLLVFLYRHRVILMTKALVLAGAFVVAVTVALIAFPDVGARLGDKFAGIIDPYADKTASWRIKGWEAQLERIVDVNPVFGEGLGGYYSWKLGSHEVNFSPHNAYVQMMLKFGLFGVLIYLLIIWNFFLTMSSVRRQLPPGRTRAFLEMGLLCFGAGHGYLLGYGFEPIILWFFGIAICMMSLHRKNILATRTSIQSEIMLSSGRMLSRATIF